MGAINNLNGALNVQSGAIVKLSGSLAIGGQNLSNRNGVGTVSISGAGSQLSTGGALNIGLWGQGGVTVADGAVATANSVTMATAALGNATLNVANNGTLATGALTAGAGTAQVNFDAATLCATAANPAFVSGFEGTGLNIAGGGLTLDTGAFNVTAASPFSGTGALTKTGRGAAVLTGDNVYTGGTTILDGTVQLGNGGTSGSIVGDINNNGTLAFQRADSYTFGGRIAGHGSVEQSGTGVRVVNVGGAGALTSEGIKVIDVQGASNGTFTLAGDYTFQGQPAVVAGAYGYRLFKNGVSTPDDGGWYLRSSLLDPAVVGAPAAAAGPLLAPTVPLYEAYSSVLQRFNELGTLQQRVGNRSWSSNASVQAEQEAGKPIIGRGAWARVEGSNTHIDPSTSTTSASYNVRMWKFEGGVDAPVIQNQSGTLVVGPTFHYGIANANVSSMFGNGAIDATGYGFGGTATWYGNNGSYVDARATLTWYDTDLRSSTLGTKLANGNRGSGVATSVEAGHQLALGGNWSITPQAQLAWSQVRFDAFTDQYGANVSRDNGNSLVSRLGVSLDHETKWTGANGKTRRSHVYGITNLYHDFLHGTSARVADISVVSKEQALWAGLGIGASMNWDDDRYTVYGEVLARTSVQDFGDSNAIGARMGFRVKW